MLLGTWASGIRWQNTYLNWMMEMKRNSECWVTLQLLVMEAATAHSSGLFYQFVGERYFLKSGFFFCSKCSCGCLLNFFPFVTLQYDEAREYVERARKCLATELAALVSLSFFLYLIFLFCTKYRPNILISEFL